MRRRPTVFSFMTPAHGLNAISDLGGGKPWEAPHANAQQLSQHSMCDAPQSLASFFISLRKVKFFPKRHLADIPRVDCPRRYLVAVWGPIMPAGPALFRNTGIRRAT